MRIRLLAVLFVLIGANAYAGPGGCTNDGTLTPFADEVLTISSTALPLTASKYAPAGASPADLAVCTLETDSVRYRVNGLNPTAAVGNLLVATSSAPKDFTVCGTQSIRLIRLIRVTTDASLTCSYYRTGSQ